MKLQDSVVAAVIIGLLCPVLAAAQDDAALARSGLFVRDRNVTVRERPHPDFSALPIPIGGFFVAPTIGASMEYNDNIYATPTAEQSDEIFRIQPALTATSDWDRNLLSLFARATANEYVDHGSESTFNWAVGSTGRLDIQHDWGVALGASYEGDTEPRTSSGSPTDSKSPVQYNVGDVNVETTKEFDRVRFTARADAQILRFNNVYSEQNALIYQADRDELVQTLAARAEYAVEPDFSVFARLAYDARGFDNRLASEPTRNSQGYEADIGANFDLTHLVRGELALGYLDQTYRSVAYQNIAGPTVRASLYYLPTQLTTLTFSGSRTVIDADIIGEGGYLSSNYVFQVDHELLRNLIITSTLGIGNDKYVGVDRVDNRYIGSVGSTYLVNRNVALNIIYSHYYQSSTGVVRGNSFNIDSLQVALRYQFGS